jgi:hypothetical protein
LLACLPACSALMGPDWHVYTVHAVKGQSYTGGDRPLLHCSVKVSHRIHTIGGDPLRVIRIHSPFFSFLLCCFSCSLYAYHHRYCTLRYIHRYIIVANTLQKKKNTNN